MIAETRILEERLGFLRMLAESESRLFFTPVPQNACAVPDCLCDGIKVIGKGTRFDARSTNSILKTNCLTVKLKFLGDPFR